MGEKKQEISVPFCWEEIPGTPKKNWKIPTNTKTSINELQIKLLPLPPSAAKSTVSIPFKWEEKPGTPLPFFSQHQYSSSSSYDQHESESPVSRFSESDSGCYESGGDEALIEWLFPLLSSTTTRSSYLEKARCHEKGVEKVEGMNEGKVFDEMKYSNVEIKRPLLTLGEMIMMSKRRSYHKKNMDMMHSQSFTKETKKRKAFLCCINGLMDIVLRKSHMNWTKQQQQQQLKFM